MRDSKYTKSTLLKSTKTFHYSQAYSENLYFFVISRVRSPCTSTAPEAWLEPKSNGKDEVFDLFSYGSLVLLSEYQMLHMKAQTGVREPPAEPADTPLSLRGTSARTRRCKHCTVWGKIRKHTTIGESQQDPRKRPSRNAR